MVFESSMNSHVLVIFWFSGESPSTRVTVVTVAAGVNLHMLSKASSRCELFTAAVAHEHLFSSHHLRTIFGYFWFYCLQRKTLLFYRSYVIERLTNRCFLKSLVWSNITTTFKNTYLIPLKSCDSKSRCYGHFDPALSVVIPLEGADELAQIRLKWAHPRYECMRKEGSQRW